MQHMDTTSPEKERAALMLAVRAALCPLNMQMIQSLLHKGWSIGMPAAVVGVPMIRYRPCHSGLSLPAPLQTECSLTIDSHSPHDYSNCRLQLLYEFNGCDRTGWLSLPLARTRARVTAVRRGKQSASPEEIQFSSISHQLFLSILVLLIILVERGPTRVPR